jgi:hypothetical protein
MSKYQVLTACLVMPLLLSCRTEPSGRVANVAKESRSENHGTVVIELTEQARRLELEEDTRFHAYLSELHPQESGYITCGLKLNQDELHKNGNYLSTLGPVEFVDGRISISYEIEPKMVRLRVSGDEGSVQECPLPSEESSLVVSVLLAYSPLVTWGSDEGLEPVSVKIPISKK